MYLTETTDELYRWFDKLNEHFFGGQLSKPIITIQKARQNTWGWCTTEGVWGTNGNEERAKMYEINIAAQGLEITEDRTIEDIVGTLLHEMIHYHNAVIGKKDCSGRIHNKVFKAEAERVLLNVEHDKKVGFGYTSPTDELVAYIDDEIKPNANCLIYYRTELKKKDKEREKKPKYKYYCPTCHKEFTIKSKMKLKCGDCDTLFDTTEII